jgi:transcriptional regulator with PAS, ATPase and Fis domain
MIKANRIVEALNAANLRFSIHSGGLVVTSSKEVKPVKEPKPPKEPRYRIASSDIAQALEVSKGSVTAAARLLGISHQRLSYMIEHRQELRERRTPKQKRLKSIIKIKKG